MKPVLLKSILRAALFSMLIISCTLKTEPGPQDEYDEANQQITNGNYNSAIATMNERLSHDPQDKRARLLLASAYAARAGVFMKDFIAIGKSITDEQKQSEETWKKNQGKAYDEALNLLNDDQLKDAVETLARVDKTVFQIKQVIAVFASIQPVPASGQKDLQTAVGILEVEPAYRDGPALYRGLLRLLLLRAQIDSHYGLAEFEKCQIDFTLAAIGLSNLQLEVKKLLQDFIFGLQPDKIGKLPQIAKDFEAQMRDVNSFVLKIPPHQMVDVSSLNRGLGRACRP